MRTTAVLVLSIAIAYLVVGQVAQPTTDQPAPDPSPLAPGSNPVSGFMECGSHLPSQVVDRMERAFNRSSWAQWMRSQAEARRNNTGKPLKREVEQAVVIPVYWTIVGYMNVFGTVGDIQIMAAMSHLNVMFAPHFQFSYQGRWSVSNAAWTLDLDCGEIVEMRKQNRKGFGPGVLNIYTVHSIASDPNKPTTIGMATFPEWYKNSANKYGCFQEVLDDGRQDGVVVRADTLPGGSYGGYGNGMNLVHEVGHWLGLLHTFQNGCGDGWWAGDRVPDTPAELYPIERCANSGRDSCGGPGRDPVNNPMDYREDWCVTSFTPNQFDRMRAQWRTYRSNAFALEDETNSSESQAALPVWAIIVIASVGSLIVVGAVVAIIFIVRRRAAAPEIQQSFQKM